MKIRLYLILSNRREINGKCKMQNGKCKMQNAKLKMENAKLKTNG